MPLPDNRNPSWESPLDGMVRVRAPDGRVKRVPSARVQDAIAAGGQLMED